MAYRIARFIGIILFNIMYRYEISGMENIPKSGSFLLCSNHTNAKDPLIIAIKSRRRIWFMAKKELFKFPPLRWLISILGAYPIDRGGTDMQAYRKTMDHLKNEKGVLIFSQGTRMKDFEGAKSGVALFALKSGAPIVPMSLTGTFKFRSKLRVKVGTPLNMDEYKGQKVRSELVEEVMNKVIGQVSALTTVSGIC